MLSDLKIINPLDIQNWDEMILRFPEYSFFHSSSWTKVLQDTYNYKPYYFTIEKEGMLLAVVPLMIVNSYFTGKRAVSLPFSDYCEPLISDNINFNMVFDEINRFNRKNSLKYLEIRGGKIFFPDVKESTFSYKHNLDLSIGEENLFKNLSSNTKRNIKKAIREDVTVDLSSSRSALEEFYQMNCATRKKHGLPPQPKKFFNNLFTYIISEEKGFIAIGKQNNLTVAGAIYLLIGKKVVYKFGASYMKYQNLRANNLVMWDAIKYSSNEGFESFCFGITEPGNEGLRKFKLGWGTKEDVSNTYKYDLVKNNFIPKDTKISGFHNKIFSNTPLPLLKIFSSISYRHFG
jgi:lipid II:glycine glycyltransferase (peptidoglycan interpeptide bridge formation enzyme)